MERRINFKNRIESALSFIVARVQISKKFNDINLIVEDTLMKLFNLVYGYNLKNANYKKN